jgi:hypothetical protein
MKLSLICMSLVSAFSLISCGSFDSRSKSAGAAQAGSPAQNGTIYPAAVAAAPVATAFSRYVASTPHAVECIDRFVAMGFPDAALIENAVERNTITRYSDIIAVGDYQTTAVPVLNVITLDAYKSAVDLRLFNPMGYYCIVSTVSFNSKITLQRSCSAQLVTMFSSDTQAPAGLHFFKWFHVPTSNTTSSGVSSQPAELPCVP